MLQSVSFDAGTRGTRLPRSDAGNHSGIGTPRDVNNQIVGELSRQTPIFMLIRCVLLTAKRELFLSFNKTSGKKLLQQEICCPHLGAAPRTPKAPPALLPRVPHLQSAWLLSLYCAVPRANHLVRSLPPDIVRDFAEAHDESIWVYLPRADRLPASG